MFNFQDPATAENDYDEVDFDMGILEDLDMLENIMEDFRGEGEEIEGAELGVRKSDRLRSKVHKAVTSRNNFKFKVIDARRPLPIPPQLLIEAQATSVPVPPAAPTYVSQIDELFKYRLFRHTVVERPQRSLPDSIYNFTHAMVNCINCSDFTGLSDLLRSHMDQECALGLYCFHSMMAPKAFLEFLNLLNIIHPDRILRITGVSSVKNRISSSVLLKFTDCRVLFNSAAVNEPSILSMFHTRAEHFKRRLCIADAEPRQQMVKLVESEEDLVMYGELQFNLTFDVVTKKATGLYISGGLTSAHPASVSITQA